MKQIYSVSKAYHSTRQKGLKKFESRTTTATIDTGEGAHVHGWGLYLQSDEKENRRLYYDTFAGNYHLGSSYRVKAFGKEFIADPTEDSCMIDDWNSFNVYDFEYPDEYTDLSSAEELVVNMLLYGYSKNDIKEFCYELVENSMDADEWDTPEILIHYTLSDIRDVAELVDEADFDCALMEPEEPEVLADGTHSEYVSQYTVEIPDDMVFIDEDSPVPSIVYVKWYEYLKTLVEYKDKIPDNPDQAWYDEHMNKFDGWRFYQSVASVLGDQEKASLWLSENGIDGMTYEGGRDGGCFVIYNCDKLKIVGVTGTNGKTSTSMILYNALNKLGKKCMYIGTLGVYDNDYFLNTNNTTPDCEILAQEFYKAVKRITRCKIPNGGIDYP